MAAETAVFMNGEHTPAEIYRRWIFPAETVGVGTGRTVKSIFQHARPGHAAAFVASSEDTTVFLASRGIHAYAPDTFCTLDTAVDGADWVDTKGALIKGGGGAFVREKIVYEMCRKYVVAVQKTKMRASLCGTTVPFEVVHAGVALFVHRARCLGLRTALRTCGDRALLQTTDGGNVIVDVEYSPRLPALADLPGVLGNGLFAPSAKTTIVFVTDGAQ